MRLVEQQRTIEELKKELARQQAKNASMAEGMRRCLSCEYRIDFKNRQDSTTQDNFRQS